MKLRAFIIIPICFSSSKTSLKNGCTTTSAVDHEVTVNDLPSTLRSQPEKLLQMGHVNAALRLSSELLKCCPDNVDLQGVLFLPVYIVLDEVPESLCGIAKYVQGSMTARTSCVKAITKCLHLIHGIYSKVSSFPEWPGKEVCEEVASDTGVGSGFILDTNSYLLVSLWPRIAEK